MVFCDESWSTALLCSDGMGRVVLFQETVVNSHRSLSTPGQILYSLHPVGNTTQTEPEEAPALSITRLFSAHVGGVVSKWEVSSAVGNEMR